MITLCDPTWQHALEPGPLAVCIDLGAAMMPYQTHFPGIPFAGSLVRIEPTGSASSLFDGVDGYLVKRTIALEVGATFFKPTSLHSPLISNYCKKVHILANTANHSSLAITHLFVDCTGVQSEIPSRRILIS